MMICVVISSTKKKRPFLRSSEATPGIEHFNSKAGENKNLKNKNTKMPKINK